MKTYNSKVTLPYFKGFNRFAIWPSPNSVVKFGNSKFIALYHSFY